MYIFVREKMWNSTGINNHSYFRHGNILNQEKRIDYISILYELFYLLNNPKPILTSDYYKIILNQII